MFTRPVGWHFLRLSRLFSETARMATVVAGETPKLGQCSAENETDRFPRKPGATHVQHEPLPYFCDVASYLWRKYRQPARFSKISSKSKSTLEPGNNFLVLSSLSLAQAPLTPPKTCQLPPVPALISHSSQRPLRHLRRHSICAAHYHAQRSAPRGETPFSGCPARCVSKAV